MTVFARKAIVICLLISMIISISGCELLGGSVRQAIAETVEAFLEDVLSGKYADDGFDSDYAIDNPFDEILLEDERVLTLVVEGLTQLRYQIAQTQGRRSDRRGDCVVVLEVVDIEAVFDDVLVNVYDEVAIIDAIGERSIDIIEIQVVFGLEYDADNREWIISDSSDFAEAFTAPYLKLDFPMSQTPEEAFEDLARAINTLDAHTLSSMFDEDVTILDVYLAGEDKFVEEIVRVIYEQFDFFMDELVWDDEYAELYITINLLDMNIIYQILIDVDLFELVLREVVLSYYFGINLSEEDVIQIYFDEFIDRLRSPDISKIEVKDVYLSMYYDAGEDKWIVDDFEGFLLIIEDAFDFDFDFDFSIYDDDDTFEMILYKVALDLLNEGLISEDFYESLIG